MMSLFDRKRKKKSGERRADNNQSRMPESVQIKFKNQDFAELRRHLLADLGREYYACLLGKHQTIGDLHIITVSDVYYPDESYYNQQGVAALRVSGEFLRERLIELSNRIDVDTMIDVHTHPFSTGNVWFSGTDDRDEINFTKYLRDEIEAKIFYARCLIAAFALSGSTICEP